MSSDRAHIEKLEKMIDDLVLERRTAIPSGDTAAIQMQIEALRRAKDEEVEFTPRSMNWNNV